MPCKHKVVVNYETNFTLLLHKLHLFRTDFKEITALRQY